MFYSFTLSSVSFFGPFLIHQLFSFVRNASLNKLIRPSNSPFPLQRARYSNKSDKKYKYLDILKNESCCNKNKYPSLLRIDQNFEIQIKSDLGLNQFLLAQVKNFQGKKRKSVH